MRPMIQSPAFNVAFGSWSCENSSALRARRRNSETLRIMKLSHPAKSRLYTELENCIFYISPMYEFSHSQGHSRHFPIMASASALPSIVLQNAAGFAAGPDLIVGQRVAFSAENVSVTG